MSDAETALTELFDGMMREVGQNTRDLAIIIRRLEGVKGVLTERERKHSDDINAIHHLAVQVGILERGLVSLTDVLNEVRERLDRISEIVVSGNGQKALVVQVSEDSLRIAHLHNDLTAIKNTLRDRNMIDISNHEGTALERVEVARAAARKQLYTALSKGLAVVGGGSGIGALLWHFWQLIMGVPPSGH